MHFYELTDNGVIPQHYVPMAKDPSRTRPSRISDFKKWIKSGKIVTPSVTTILDVLGKPRLVNWKIDQHLMQAYRFDGNVLAHLGGIDNYISEIKRLTELEMDKAPSAGTDIHKSIDAFFNGELDSLHQDYQLCENIQREIFAKCDLTPEAVFQTEVSFVAGEYGGQVDLIIEDVNQDWVIDFKTKQTADKFKPGKMAYDEHAMQLSAYRLGVDLRKAKCANLFVCIEDWSLDFHQHSEADLERCLSMFFHCLGLWRLKNKIGEIK